MVTAIISRRKPVMNRHILSVSVVSAFAVCVLVLSSCAHAPSVRTPHTSTTAQGTATRAGSFPINGIEAILDSTGLAEYAGEDDTVVESETDVEGIFRSAQERYEKAYECIASARAQIDTALGLLDEIRDTEDSTALTQRDEMILEFSHLMRQLGFVEQRGTVSMNGEIPLQMNQFVEREIRSFQTVERSWFLGAYRRSGVYLPYIKARMREAGLPEQLAWLAFIESGYSPRALSPARALGLWQFIPSTGYRYGMTRDRWIDHRMDFERSTTAAIAYLRDLHAMFGDWNAALAAYNCGEGRVLRTINSQANQYMDDFWDLYVRLPQETARYVPRFHAVMAIMQDPLKYGFSDLPQPEPPIAYDTLIVDRQVKLADIAERTGISADVLTRLNAELRTGITPQYPYRLRVPVGTLDSVTVALNSAPTTSAPNLPDLITHRVKRGETIASIARKHHTTVTAIRQENGLRKNSRVRVGQILRIPVRSRAATPSQVASSSPRTARRNSNSHSSEGSPTTYVVRSGDTLWSISQRYSLSVDELRNLNGLNRRSTIKPGQRLVVSR